MRAGIRGGDTGLDGRVGVVKVSFKCDTGGARNGIRGGDTGLRGRSGVVKISFKGDAHEVCDACDTQEAFSGV